MGMGKQKLYATGKELYDKAAVLVKTEQQAGYAFLKDKFPGIGVGTSAAVLKELTRKKILVRGDRRSYVVAVNPDGSPKDAATLPEPRRYRTLRRNRMNGASSNQISPKTDAPKSVDEVTEREKLEVLLHLSKAAGGKTARVLKAIMVDLQILAKHRALLAALSD
jgi:hypothetical protein